MRVELLRLVPFHLIIQLYAVNKLTSRTKFINKQTRLVFTTASLILVITYQEAFLTPGILPSKAISLKTTLHIPNCLI